MIWCVLKKNEYAVQEKPFTISNQISNTLKQNGISSKSTIKRYFHKCKYKGFIKRCKPLVTEQNVAKVRNTT